MLREILYTISAEKRNVPQNEILEYFVTGKAIYGIIMWNILYNSRKHSIEGMQRNYAECRVAVVGFIRAVEVVEDAGKVSSH